MLPVQVAHLIVSPGLFQTLLFYCNFPVKTTMESCIPSPLLLCSCLWSKRKYPLCMCLLIKVTCMQARPRIHCWYNGNLNSVTQFFFMNIWLMILRRMLQIHTRICCQTQLKLKHMVFLVSVPFLGFIFILPLLLWVFLGQQLWTAG